MPAQVWASLDGRHRATARLSHTFASRLRIRIADWESSVSECSFDGWAMPLVARRRTLPNALGCVARFVNRRLAHAQQSWTTTEKPSAAWSVPMSRTTPLMRSAPAMASMVSRPVPRRRRSPKTAGEFRSSCAERPAQVDRVVSRPSKRPRAACGCPVMHDGSTCPNCRQWS